ncbi:MAG TPA: xanthine dehydrogenase family protein subunit M [Actinomycetota bacterium]|nr:xanthine dehydrogenase family protein subunit M [Actinomycetota bacterium]
MLPARFEYHRPQTVEEALELLDRYAEDAKVLAGGMSLIPLMKLRFASPGRLVDVNRIPELQGMEESDGWLRVRAITRHNEIADSELVRARYPAMAAAAPVIADPLVRNLGTLAGSLAHADPAGDWGSVMLALEAEVVARSVAGERVIPLRDLFVSSFTTSLRPNELITEVRVPAPRGRSGGTYLKLERKVGDFATVGVAVQLTLDDGKVGRAGIALTAVGPTNLWAVEAEQALAGAEPTEEAFAEAARLAARAAEPTTDVRGSAEYKRHMVEVYTRRGLARALELARGAGA